MRFLVILCASALLAQTPTLESETARARALLASPDLRDQAWGAAIIGAHHLTALHPELIQALRRTSLDNGAYWTVQALLDAAIRSDADVPADVLLRFEPGWRNEVIILLGRDAVRNQAALLNLRHTALRASQWIAVNKLLLNSGSVRFIELTLRDLKITHRIVVEDVPPRSNDSLSGVGDAASLPTTVRCAPKGFPAIGLYRVGVSSTEAPHFFSRTPVSDTCASVPKSDTSKLDPFQMQSFLQSYAGILGLLSPEETAKLFRASSKLTWSDPASAARAIAQLLSEHAAKVRAFIAGVSRRNPIDISTVPMTIEVVLRDQRIHQTAPLPAIASYPVNP